MNLSHDAKVFKLLFASRNMNIRVKAIVEIVGAPKDHVDLTLKNMVGRIDSLEKSKIIEQEIFPAEEKEELFSAFAELEIEFQNLTSVYSFCFNFLPSSIDIIEPEKLSVEAGEFNGSLNDLLATLHNMDMLLKNSNARVKMLTKNVDIITQNFIRHVTKEPKTVSNIANETGINEENAQKLLDHLEKNNGVKKDGDKYVIQT